MPTFLHMISLLLLWVNLSCAHFLGAAAAGKLLQSCLTLCNPIDSNPPAPHHPPRSLGFSEQEHWSGLPFPSPIHQSEKWKLSCSVVSDSSQHHGLQPTRPLHPWDFLLHSCLLSCILANLFFFLGLNFLFLWMVSISKQTDCKITCH